MKLHRLHIIKAESCGGLLDGFIADLHPPDDIGRNFKPLCLIGPNGAGKSQVLQVLAEIFQLVWNACSSPEERVVSNSELQFRLDYSLLPEGGEEREFVRLKRVRISNKKPILTIERRLASSDDWIKCDESDSETVKLLPQKIIAYSSGGNETLSLPFLVSRSGYAKDVTEAAFKRRNEDRAVPDTRLMLIDYGTHIEVLAANLLLGTEEIRAALLSAAPISNLHSFRCIIQLAHSSYPKINIAGSKRKGIQITEELESYLDFFTRCATCHDYDEKTETYTFDFFVDEQVRTAFREFWAKTLDLYSSFHKFSMLNDLAIPKATRERFKRESRTRRFASRLAEPQDEEKVFRFERVCFSPIGEGEPVDYVSLSDGEHQLAQILGTMAMTSFPNVLFLLDEPESHFNPKWRVEFISRLLDLPTENGIRRDASLVAQQDCLLTTHAPFVPSDMPRENVLIFRKTEGKIEASRPSIETFGSAFDSILNDCFGIRPPISAVARDQIEALMQSDDPEAIRLGMKKLGNSVEKAFLADRAENLPSQND
ncbi:ABC transporter [Spartobacteria bacterium LR76]|nr:ABC transporter [Spartobacteria bacterium LR76]